MRLIFTFSLVLLSYSLLLAQKTKTEGFGIRATLSGGRIIKHSPKFKAPVRGNTVWSEINIEQQTDGTQRWHHTHQLPTLGLSFNYANFGDPEIFGWAFGILPNMTFGNRTTTQKWYSFARVGMGIAYLNRPFDAMNNQLNTVIGQNINNITDLRGGFGFWLSPNIDFSVGGGLTHYSDGASQLPNLGINVPALFVNLCYQPHRILPTPKNNTYFDDSASNAKRWHTMIQLDYGVHEQIVEGGPKYFFASTSLGAMYDLSHKHHLLSGITYEFSENNYLWGKYHRLYSQEDALIWNSSRLAWYIGDEMQFGQFAFSASLGIYIKNSIMQPFSFYQKIAWRYYFLPQQQVQPYLNIQLKAHLSIAEYFSIGAGARF